MYEEKEKTLTTSEESDAKFDDVITNVIIGMAIVAIVGMAIAKLIQTEPVKAAITGLGVWAWLILLIPSIILGFVCKTIADSKGYNDGFLWGFFLEFIGLIVVIARPKRKDEAEIEAQASAAQSNYIQALESLAELRDKGVISEEEFARKKQDLMRRI